MRRVLVTFDDIADTDIAVVIKALWMLRGVTDVRFEEVPSLDSERLRQAMYALLNVSGVNKPSEKFAEVCHVLGV